MGQFASATFTGSSGTELSAADSNWTKHPAASAANLVLSNANRVRQSATNAAGTYYYHSGSPASADYSVSATGFAKETSAGDAAVGVSGRVDTTAATQYHARYAGGATDAWQLFKFVAGTATQLGSNSAQALTDETGYAIELRMVGTTIELYKQGSSTPTISVTDSSITAAGKAGIRFFQSSGTVGDNNGLHIDDFSAVDIARLYLRSTQTNGIGSTYYDLSETAGALLDDATVTTTASGTEIQFTKTAGGAIAQWVSGRAPPGGFTLTSVNASIRAIESGAAVNAGLRLRVFKREAAGTETEIAGGPFDDGVELPTAPSAAYTFTADVTDTAFAEDDRVLLKVYATNIGTMAAGTATLGFNEADGTAGDSYVVFFPSVAFKAEDAGSALSAAGVSTATLSGASSAQANLSAAGAATAQFAGASAGSGALSAIGAGTATFEGAQIAGAEGALDSSGTSQAQFAGASSQSGALSAAGASTATFEGAQAAGAAGALSVSGTSQALFAGAAAVSGALFSAGTSTAALSSVAAAERDLGGVRRRRNIPSRDEQDLLTLVALIAPMLDDFEEAA